MSKNKLDNPKDLADHHGFIGQYFPKLNPEEAWERYSLYEDQIIFYRENGFLAGVKVLDDDQIELLHKELRLIMEMESCSRQLFYEYHSNESSDSDTVLFHCLGQWRNTPGFHDVLWNPAFVIPAFQLLGNKTVRFWHDQLFCKPPLYGGVVAWHQDYSYWQRTIPMNHLTCWMALDDTSEQNGCLRYIPGSHKWDLFEKGELAGKMDGILGSLIPEQRSQIEQSKSVELQKGYASFHHPLLVHGSFENRSENPRRALVLNVFEDGTLSDSNEALLQGVPIVPKGEKLSGKFFPILYQNAEKMAKE